MCGVVVLTEVVEKVIRGGSISSIRHRRTKEAIPKTIEKQRPAPPPAQKRKEKAHYRDSQRRPVITLRTLS